jgi:hypothetical protein
MPPPIQATAKATASGTNQNTPTTVATSKTLIPSLWPLSKHKALPVSAEMATNTPTRLPDNNAPQPQGTSPMAVGADDDVSNKSPSTVKSDPKESNGESQGKGSLSDLIASTRRHSLRVAHRRMTNRQSLPPEHGNGFRSANQAIARKMTRSCQALAAEEHHLLKEPTLRQRMPRQRTHLQRTPVLRSTTAWSESSLKSYTGGTMFRRRFSG